MSVESFINKKITFILGAGASIPFIKKGDVRLTTDYLTEQIANPDLWEHILDEFKNAIPEKRHPEHNFNINQGDVLSVINKLKKINNPEVPKQLQKQFSVPQNHTDFYGIGKLNFEHVVYLLDKVCLYLYDPKSNIDNILFEIWKIDDAELNTLRAKSGWDHVPFLCREVLVKAIIDLWESCEKQEAIKTTRDFFTSVLEKFKAVSIYSLNYDPLLYEAVSKIKVNGFAERDGEKSFETGFYNNDSFNYKKFYYRNNVVAFLHGHIGFVSGMRDYIRFNGNYRDAQKVRIEDAACGRGGYYREGQKGVHYNVCITSGLEKFESMYVNPYACYIQRFSEDVMESEYIVFIGSGLGDRHVNLFATTVYRAIHGYAEDIMSLCDLRRDHDERKKIIIVTQEQHQGDFLKTLGLTDVGKGIYSLFGGEGIASNGKNTNDILKNNGYANFNFDSGFLYVKGTEQFFSEIWSINELF